MNPSQQPALSAGIVQRNWTQVSDLSPLLERLSQLGDDATRGGVAVDLESAQSPRSSSVFPNRMTDAFISLPANSEIKTNEEYARKLSSGEGKFINFERIK